MSKCHYCNKEIQHNNKKIYIDGNKLICDECLKEALESPLNTQFKRPDLNEDGTYKESP
jgi:ribosome-binding protein aMBF1 (putative translation factor)